MEVGSLGGRDSPRGKKVLCIHLLQYRDAEIIPEYRVAQPPEV